MVCKSWQREKLSWIYKLLLYQWSEIFIEHAPSQTTLYGSLLISGSSLHVNIFSHSYIVVERTLELCCHLEDIGGAPPFANSFYYYQYSSSHKQSFTIIWCIYIKLYTTSNYFNTENRSKAQFFLKKRTTRTINWQCQLRRMAILLHWLLTHDTHIYIIVNKSSWENIFFSNFC